MVSGVSSKTHVLHFKGLFCVFKAVVLEACGQAHNATEAESFLNRT